MNRRALMLGTIFLTSFGGIVSLLGATTISTELGAQVGAPAFFTGVLIAAKYAPSIVAMPYATSFAAKWGTKPLFLTGQMIMIVLNLMLAWLIAIGAPTYATLVVFTTIMGFVGAMLHALVPVVMKSYLPSKSIAGSLSKAAVANGLAAVLGALFGTVMLAHVVPELTFVVNAVFTIPYVLVLWLTKPATPVGSPTHVKHAWRTLATTLTKNRRVLRASLLAVTATLFIGPMSSMVVPLTRDTGIALTSNAGYLLAVLAIGQMFSPYGVGALSRRFNGYYGGATAIIVAAFALIGFAASVWLRDPAWVMYAGVIVASLIFGNMRYAAENLLIDDVATAVQGKGTTQGNISAFEFLASLAAPIGPLIWGAMMDGVGAVSMLIILSAILVVLTLLFIRRARHEGVANTPLVSR